MSQILLLEDDANLGRGLKMSLELEGYKVSWATDIRSAESLEALGSHDLYLLDWNLPDGTGADFCDKLRTKNTSVPIIFLTARTDEDSAVKALTSGANDFVRKPVGQAELLARIKTALKEPTTREEHIRLGDLVIYPKQRRATYRDADVEMNRREFDILTFLVRRAGTTVTRNELLELIDHSGQLYDRTIDSHLSHLRARLKKAAVSSIQISSVYGVGYRLEKV